MFVKFRVIVCIPNNSSVIWNASLSFKQANKHYTTNKQTILFYIYPTLKKIAKSWEEKRRRCGWCLRHRPHLHFFFKNRAIFRFSDFAIFKKIDHSLKKIDLFFSANYCRITKIAKSQNRKIKKSRWNINRCGWCLSTYLIKFCQLFKVVQ